MAEVYVTLGEAAELERVKYNTMVKRVLRKQESFVTKTEKSENGGKDVVLVAVSSLSKQARNAWKEREKLKSFTEEFPDKKEDEQKPEVPWYVNTDVDWYIENYKERYYKAVELGNVVRKFLQYDEGDRTKYAEEFAQKYLGKGQRTLYRYTKAYLEASAWADKLEKEDGAGREFFKVLCLCRKPKETGCFPSIKPEVKQVIKNIWFNEDFARNQGTREMLYEKLTAIANINKWEKIPSYQTVTRYISYLMEDEGMRNAWFLASRGTREYKNKVMVKGSRDTKGLQVMQIVIRCLVKGYNNTALTRQLSNAMIAAGLIISPDISKYLDYLQGAGYIEFTEEKVTAYNAYANDAVIKLTKEGVDLAEGTIEDNGVDI